MHDAALMHVTIHDRSKQLSLPWFKQLKTFK